MKNILFSLLVIFAATATIIGQAASDSYQLGDRKVRIPPPDGFVEISSQFKRVGDRLRSTESPHNDMLAVHVPEPFTAKLRVSENIDLGFYTKLSVSKRVRVADVTPADYSAVVADAEKHFASYMDPKGPMMKDVEKNSGKGLTEFLGEKTSVSISGTTNLGFFEKTDKSYSGMVLINAEVGGRKLTVLGTVSFVYVGKRIVFAYAYKLDPTTDDVPMLRDFAKNWTESVDLPSYPTPTMTPDKATSI